MLKYFNTNILRKKQLRDGIVYPFNVHLDQAGLIKDPSLSERKAIFDDDYFFPPFTDALKSVRSGSHGRIISIFDYFKKLREWATYEEPYLFFRIYSPHLRQNFQKYLTQIIDPFIFMTEAYLIKLHGFGRINDQKEIFIDNLENYLNIPANDISDRFNFHHQYKT